jgi:hypothetical protein
MCYQGPTTYFSKYTLNPHLHGTESLSADRCFVYTVTDVDGDPPVKFPLTIQYISSSPLTSTGHKQTRLQTSFSQSECPALLFLLTSATLYAPRNARCEFTGMWKNSRLVSESLVGRKSLNLLQRVSVTFWTISCTTHMT